MIPSLEGWPTKAKEAPSPHEVKTGPAGHQPSNSKSRGEKFQALRNSWYSFHQPRKYERLTRSIKYYRYYQIHSYLMTNLVETFKCTL